MTIKLYSAPGSCSIAVQIALEEAGAVYEEHMVLLADGEQRRPEYLAINSRGRIPTLVIDERPITEVLAILTYIARRFPDAQLLPFDDLILLARAYERMSWYASGLHVAVAQIFRPERFTLDQQAWPIIQAGGRATLESGFYEIDELLDGPWILGERFSIVDCYSHAFWRWGERLELNMALHKRWAAQNYRLVNRVAAARAIAAEEQAKHARTGTSG